MIAEFQKASPGAARRHRPARAGKNFDQAALRKMAGPLQQFELMAQYGLSAGRPAAGPATARARAGKTSAPACWNPAAAGTVPSCRGVLGRHGHRLPPAESRKSSTGAWRNIRPGWSRSSPRKSRKGRAEFYYNDVKAFLHATIIYIFAFVLACGALLTFGVCPACPNPCGARRFT